MSNLYNKVAEILAEEAIVANVALRLADYFETENPRFDRERFLAAAGYLYPGS